MIFLKTEIAGLSTFFIILPAGILFCARSMRHIPDRVHSQSADTKMGKSVQQPEFLVKINFFPDGGVISMSCRYYRHFWNASARYGASNKGTGKKIQVEFVSTNLTEPNSPGIYTMPTHMVYNDYRKAALKHLKTCLFMTEHLDNITEPRQKRDILRNIYYIGGYVIECSINYKIYKESKRYKKGPTRDIEKLCETLKPKGKSTEKKTVRFYSKDHPPADYKISGHNYPKYKEVLEYCLPAQKLGKMPILADKVDLNDPLSVLFYSWRVVFRYQTDDTHFQPSPENSREKDIFDKFREINYNEDSVKDFINLAETLYIELIK